MLVIENDNKYFYVPNTSELEERNEFLSRGLPMNMKEPKENVKPRPHIGKVSRELARERRKVCEM